MKTNSYSLFRLFCACLCLCLLLCACSRVTEYTVRDDGGIYNKKSKQSYDAAPSYYHAYSYHPDDVAGIYTDPDDGIEKNLYRITGSGNYLCDEEYNLYLPKGETLPALSEMEITKISLCQPAAQFYAERSYTDSDEIAGILNAVLGASVPYSRVQRSADQNYSILFLDTDLGLVLELEYLVYVEPVIIYEPLNADGSAPALYGVEPSVEELSGEKVAVYDLGTQLILNRSAGVCCAVHDLL